MWWAISFGAVVLVAYLFTKFRAASYHIQLVTAAQNQLRVSFRMLNVPAEGIDERVWRDPYLLGFAQGSIAMMTHFFGGKLDTVQKGMVAVNVLRGLVGERYGDICERMSELHDLSDSEFMRGTMNGSDVIILMSNRPGTGLLADLDVQAAMRDAPAFERTAAALFGEAKSGPFNAAGGALLHTYMKRHKEMAGYH